MRGKEETKGVRDTKGICSLITAQGKTQTQGERGCLLLYHKLSLHGAQSLRSVVRVTFGWVFCPDLHHEAVWICDGLKEEEEFPFCSIF
jgi:hypothetical protein